MIKRMRGSSSSIVRPHKGDIMWCSHTHREGERGYTRWTPQELFKKWTKKTPYYGPYRLVCLLTCIKPNGAGSKMQQAHMVRKTYLTYLDAVLLPTRLVPQILLAMWPITAIITLIARLFSLWNFLKKSGLTPQVGGYFCRCFDLSLSLSKKIITSFH